MSLNKAVRKLIFLTSILIGFFLGIPSIIYAQDELTIQSYFQDQPITSALQGQEIDQVLRYFNDDFIQKQISIIYNLSPKESVDSLYRLDGTSNTQLTMG